MDLSLDYLRLHSRYVGTYNPKLRPRDNWKVELIDWVARNVAPGQVLERIAEIQGSMEPLEQLSRRWISQLNFADQTCARLKNDGSSALYRLHKLFPTGRRRSDEEWAAFCLHRAAQVSKLRLAVKPSLVAKLKSLEGSRR